MLCKDCKQEKPHHAKDLCKACYNRRWAKENPERKRAIILRYDQAHREKRKLAAFAYRQEHHEEVLAYYRRYREEHREERRVYNRLYHQRHREEILARKRYYRAENLNKVKAQQSSYYQAHKEECRARLQRWRVENPEKTRVLQARSRARERALPDSLTPAQAKQKLLIGRCFYCGKELDLVLDHFVPLGLEENQACGTTRANTIAACKSCNSKKWAKNPTEILEQLCFV